MNHPMRCQNGLARPGAGVRRRTRPADLLALLALTLGLPRLAGATPLSFEVSFTPEVRSTPFTGRILVFTGTHQEPEPRLWVDNFGSPEPFYALDVQQLPPNQSVRIDEHALGYPAPPTDWPSGLTRFQAVLDQAPDDRRIGTAPGNGYSPVVEAQPSDAPVKLVIDQLVPARKFAESSRVKLVEIPSPRLTAFSGWPMRLRAAVVLPDGYLEQPEKRFPVVYWVLPFPGDHFWSLDLPSFWANLVAKSGPNALVVVPDPQTHWGHDFFADSANNGPVGSALVEELVPEIDRTFRTIADPKARLLTGSSAGGWSSLWLQCTHPDLFGGVWSTAPTPVDFRNFARVDLYAPGANLFTDSQGRPNPSARDSNGSPVGSFQADSDMATVLGHGRPQEASEAAYSPRGADGRPQPLYDRRTGAIDPAVVAQWQQYDIGQKLTRDWGVLGPKLAGRLHVYIGSKDDFSFDGAVGLLKQSLAALGSDAVIEILPGKDHFAMFFDPSINARIAAEMRETLRRAGMIGGSGAP
jgi:S-formylglutathione hydrolase FrmB